MSRPMTYLKTSLKTSLLTILSAGIICSVSYAQDYYGDEGIGRMSEALALAETHNIERISNLNQALLETYISNPTLRAERAELRATHEEYPQAIANFLPSLTWNANLDANNLRGDNIDGDVDGAATKEFSFEIDQPIYSGGSEYAELQEAINDIEAAKYALLNEEQDIFVDMVQAYLDVIRDRKSLNLQIKNETILQTRLNNSERLFEAGELTKADVSQSRARLSNAQSERIDAEIDLQNTIENFYNIVGMMPADKLALPTIDVELPKSLDEVKELARNHNPEIKEAYYDHLAAKAAAEVEYRALLPQVSMTASISNQIDPGPGNNKSRREQAVGLSMSVPFFQGGAQRSEVREAKINANQLQLEMVQVIRDVMEESTNTWREYQSAKRKIELRQIQVNSAVEARDAVKREVEAGERTYVDLLDADQDLLDAELNLILAERNLIIKAYELKAVIGEFHSQRLDFTNTPSVYSGTQNFDDVTSIPGFMSVDAYEDTRDLVSEAHQKDVRLPTKYAEASPKTVEEPKIIQAAYTPKQPDILLKPAKKPVQAAAVPDVQQTQLSPLPVKPAGQSPAGQSEAQSHEFEEKKQLQIQDKIEPAQQEHDDYQDVKVEDALNNIEPAAGQMDEIDDAAPLHDRQATATAQDNEPSKPLFVQVATFQDYKAAERLSRRLQEYGTTFIFSKKHNFKDVYEVQLGPVKDRSHGIHTINTLESEGYKGAILRQN